MRSTKTSFFFKKKIQYIQFRYTIYLNISYSTNIVKVAPILVIYSLAIVKSKIGSCVRAPNDDRLPPFCANTKTEKRVLQATHTILLN